MLHLFDFFLKGFRPHWMEFPTMWLDLRRSLMVTWVCEPTLPPFPTLTLFILATWIHQPTWVQRSPGYTNPGYTNSRGYTNPDEVIIGSPDRTSGTQDFKRFPYTTWQTQTSVHQYWSLRGLDAVSKFNLKFKKWDYPKISESTDESALPSLPHDLSWGTWMTLPILRRAGMSVRLTSSLHLKYI